MAEITPVIKKAYITPKESIIPFSFNDFFLVLRRVTIIPLISPIIIAANGFVKIFDEDPKATAP
jgi:hypothetical protein